MSAALTLLHDLAVIGARVEPAGDRLILRAGFTAIPADLIVLIRETKAEEFWETLAAAPANEGWSAEDWQTRLGELAGRFEFDCGFSRPAAEAKAFEACIIEWCDRNPAPSPAGRCAWCGQLEPKSASIVPFGTEPGTQAWLHGECWRPWQNARRAEAVKALSRFGILSDAAQSERP